MINILMHFLLGTLLGPYVIAWGCLLLGIAACFRFRWAVLFAVGSVLLIILGMIGLLTYYDGVQDPSGGAVIEGPEFFGMMFVVMGSSMFAAFMLLISAGVARLRHMVVTRLQLQRAAN